MAPTPALLMHVLLMGQLHLALSGQQLTLTVDVDNVLDGVFVDGDPLPVSSAASSSWLKTDTFSIPPTTQVIALEGTDVGVACGIIAALDTGEVTDTSWKCSDTYHQGWELPGFDDSNWANAKHFGRNGVSPWGTIDSDNLSGAYWIWHTRGCGRRKAYCRKNRQSQQLTLTVDVDNVLDGVFVDGVRLPGSSAASTWLEADTFSIPPTTQVIALEGSDKGQQCGIIAALDNGEVTDTSWKCSAAYHQGWELPGFDDSNWANAKQFGQYGVWPWHTRVDSDNLSGAYWIWHTGGCGRRKAYCRMRREIQKYPKSCKESYHSGNKQSGKHLLQAAYGDVFEVFCYFSDRKTGFVFPSRSAVGNVDSLNVADLSSYNNEVLILEKDDNGATSEALVKPLPRLTRYGLTNLHNEWTSFAAPLRRNKFGDKFLYLGILNEINYQQNIQHDLGFVSNGQSITYSDCDENPNNYFVFYANKNNAAFCETGWSMGQSFLDSFRSSRCPEVMQSPDYWFTLEMHFGGCGMRYANSGCYGRKGYAIGFPFNL